MFLEAEKYKILREASKKGDEKAKKLLKMMLDNKSDGFLDGINDYFTPKSNKEAAESQEIDADEDFLLKNGFMDDINEENIDEDVDDVINNIVVDEECSNWSDICNKLVSGIINMVGDFDKTTLFLVNDNNLSEAERKGMLSTIQECKNSLFEQIEKLKKLQNNVEKAEKID